MQQRREHVQLPSLARAVDSLKTQLMPMPPLMFVRRRTRGLDAKAAPFRASACVQTPTQTALNRRDALRVPTHPAAPPGER